MIFGSNIFKQLNKIDSFVRGKVGVSLLPGSTRVYDRVARQMVVCNTTLCPYSEVLQQVSRSLFVAWAGMM
jgi:hypothetical protein